MSFFEVETQHSSVQIEDETGEKMGLTIELRPLSSPEAQRVQRAGRTRIFEATRKGLDTSGISERNGRELLAACIVGWTWSDAPQLVTKTGKVVKLKPVEYSPDNAIKLVSDRDFPFVARQIDEHLGAASNFFAG